MKTLFLWQGGVPADRELAFFEIPGDWSHLDGVLLEASVEKMRYEAPEEFRHHYSKEQEQLSNLLFKAPEHPVFGIRFRNREKIYHHLFYKPTKDWDFFVRCGIID